MTEKSPIKVHWWNGRPNFGDALSPLAVEFVSGRPTQWAGKEEMEVLSTGSIMIRAARAYGQPRDHRPLIWGTGMMSPVRTAFVPHVDFAAVRGPITRTLLDLPPLPYGDPGLLIARAATTEVERGDAIGLIPHHGDFKDAATKGAIAALQDKGELRIIDPRSNDVFAVADEIRACRHVFSSSLHGLILSDGFNVPNTWVAGRAIHATPALKFMDYFLSVGREYREPIPYEAIEDAEKGTRGASAVPYAARVEETKDALIDAFPKHMKA